MNVARAIRTIHPGFTLDHFTLRRLCDELRQTWIGVSIRRTWLTPSADLYLCADDPHTLLLSDPAGQARIVTLCHLPPDIQVPPPWIDTHVTGYSINQIHLVGHHPVIRIALESHDSRGALRQRYSFYVELIGGWQNNVFLVCEENGRIIGDLRRVKGGAHRTDTRKPGDIYQAPPLPTGIPPEDLTPADLHPIQNAADLACTVTGLDLHSAQDLLIQHGPPTNSIRQQHLLEAIRNLCADPPWAKRPAIIKVDGSHTIRVLKSDQALLSDRVEFNSVNAAIAELALRDQSRTEALDTARSMQRQLKKRVSALKRQTRRIQADLGQDESSATTENPSAKRRKKGHKATRMAQLRLEEAHKQRADLEQALGILTTAAADQLKKLQVQWTACGWL
jgi:predicted ribosome quality control (RQC) complex YloA/Tae2 family protein